MAKDIRVDISRVATRARFSGAQDYPSARLQYPYPGPALSRERRQIRVLCLEGLPVTSDTRPDHDSPLYGDLVVRDLDDTPSYVALSYVWGRSDPQNPRTIRMRRLGSPDEGTGQVSITENGYQALWHIRKKFGAAYIWVDAICINQDDVTERNHQVSQMGDIYSSAQRVYVWLGVGDQGTDQAMQYLRAVGNSSERMPITVEDGKDGPKWKQYQPQFDWQLCKGRVMNLPWTFYARHFQRSFPGRLGRLLRLLLPSWLVQSHDLTRVLENEWLMRSWTLPEFILARDSLLICGNEIMPWQEFLGCIWRGPLKHGSQAMHWQALAQAWLSLPRHERDLDGKEVAFTMRERLHPSKATVFLADRKLGYYVVAPLLAGLTAVGVYYQNARTSRGGEETLLYYLALILPPIAVVLVVSFVIYVLLTLLYGANRGSDLPLQSYGDNELFNVISAAILNRNCSLPQDKCFSLYSVLARHGIDMGYPDYTADPQEVYARFFDKLLEHNPQALALLVDASQRSTSGVNPPTTPSWALDLNKHQRPPWLPREFVLGGETAGPNTIRPFVNTEGGVLTVPAISLGIITFRTDFAKLWEYHKGAAQDVAKAALTELVLLLEHTQDTYISRPSKASLRSTHFLFFRSVMMPDVWLKWNHQHHSTTKGHGTEFKNKSELRWWERRSNFNALAAEYKGFFIPLLRIIRKHRKYREKDMRRSASPDERLTGPTVLPARSIERLYRAIKGKKKLVEAFSTWCKEVSEYRRRSFFTTATGFPATGGMDICVGDELFYVPNAPTLLVLRRRLDGPGYSLVSPASGPFKASEIHPGAQLQHVEIH